jgi:hypothetical protein
VPKGGRPVAAKATVLAHECTSAGAPASSPSMISGARYPGVPMTRPVAVSLVESTACAMPKSITIGSPSRNITLPGLRSRWITPAPWIAASARARPAASRCSPDPYSGPCSKTVSSSVLPGTYCVTTYGGSAVTSASMISATCGLCTRRIVSTSRASRRSAVTSPATAGRNTLIATLRPCESAAR